MNMDNTTTLLSLIEEIGDGRILGKKKMNKLVFLLEFLDSSTGKLTQSQSYLDFDFRIYHYGPFSFNLGDKLQEMEDEGLIEREEKLLGTEKGIVYSITEEGEKRINERTGGENPISENKTEVLEEASDLNGSQLENISLELLGIKGEKENYKGLDVKEIIIESQDLSNWSQAFRNN